MSNRAKARLIYTLGMICCIVPSVLCVAEYFPIWKEAHPSVLASGILVSGLSVAIIACVALPPIAKWAKNKISGMTPSAWLGFAIAAVVFKVIKSVVDSLVIIFTIAALSNFIGAILFKVANRVALIPDPDDEEDGEEREEEGNG